MINKLKNNIEGIKTPKTYPIRWCVNGLQIGGHFGLCGYSRKVAFIDNSPNPSQIIEKRTISIKNGKCSCLNACLNLKCKYNATTEQSFIKNIVSSKMNLSKKEWKNFIKNRIFDRLVLSIELLNYSIKQNQPGLLKFDEYSVVNFKKPIIKQKEKFRRCL